MSALISSGRMAMTVEERELFSLLSSVSSILLKKTNKFSECLEIFEIDPMMFLLEPLSLTASMKM